MTREFFRRPFLRWALGSLDLHPTRKRIAEPGLVRAVRALLARDEAVVIYPEGGSRWAGRPGKWIETTGKIFARFGYPVYPVLMHGSYVTWPRWATYPRPGRIEVEILPALTFHEKTSLPEVLRRLQHPIARDESVVEDRLRPKWAYKPADGIQRLLYRDPVTGGYDGLFTPDGTVVTNRDGSMRLKMLPDSRLLDERSGELRTTGDLYEAIRAIPFEADSNGILLQDVVELSVEVDFPKLVSHGTCTVRLTREAVLLGEGRNRRDIPLEGILAVDIERNYKLQLTLRDKMVQFAFTRRGSALAWKDALEQLLGGNGPSQRS